MQTSDTITNEETDVRPPAASSWVCLLLLLWQPLRGLESQPALRGTWLTTTANDHLHSAELIDASLTRLVDIGCNTVYIESWKNGYTQFPSAVLQATIGVDRHPELGRNGRPDDLLEATVLAAQRRGLLAVAWFE